MTVESIARRSGFHILLALLLSLSAAFLLYIASASPAQAQGPTPTGAECLGCHLTGVAGAPKSPPDHSGRLDAACLDCHIPQ